MLTAIDKKGRAAGFVSTEDTEALLAAFARPGVSACDRTLGEAVVRRIQQRQHWLRCSCLGPAEPAPVLVPVAERHLRRDPHFPDHAETCPFEMDGADRERLASSMRQRAPSGGFRLARAIGQPDDDEAPRIATTGLRKADSRSRLSQLLFDVVARTGLHRVGRGPRGWDDQVRGLHVASRAVPLGGGLRLSSALEIDPARIGGLVERITARTAWPRGLRPHGVLIFIADRIEGPELFSASGVRVPVAGPISVFGPGRGRIRQGPFLAAALIASPDGAAPFALLQAYAHPCWLATDMLPVDSTHERRCLDILVRFQTWMAGQGHRVEITKPLYDRSDYYLGRAEPGRVVKPDFEGTIHTAAGAWVRSFAAECKGFDHAEYRAIKAWLKSVIQAKRTYYLDHLAYDPRHTAEHDMNFARDLARLGGWAINKTLNKAAHPPQGPPKRSVASEALG